MAELFLNNLLDADALFVMAQPVIFVSKALPNCAQERQMLILLFDPRGRKEVEDVLMILRANRVPPPSSRSSSFRFALCGSVGTFQNR